MSERQRILFVDDDINVLNGLRRMLYSMRNELKMEFVTKASDALKVMEDTHYDLIISDLRMPDMDGVQFLETVRDKYPETIRFMLTGYTDQPLRGKAARCAHQLVSKPCDAEHLGNLICQAISLHNRIKSNEVTQILSELKALPVLPDVYQDVIDQLNEPDASPRKIGQMIAQDIGMSTKILQLVNSAFYGANNAIADPIRAVVHLGLKTMEALLITDGIFSKLPEKKVRDFCVDGLQEHCARVGFLTRIICQSQELSEEELELATMAGILHDTGKMVLIARFPDEYKEAIRQSRDNQKSLYQIERELIGVTHTELGGCLMELWGLPNAIIETATYHHEPEHCITDYFTTSTAVYTANHIDHELCSSMGDGCFEDYDRQRIEEKGLAQLWQKCRVIHIPTETEECVDAV